MDDDNDDDAKFLLQPSIKLIRKKPRGIFPGWVGRGRMRGLRGFLWLGILSGILTLASASLGSSSWDASFGPYPMDKGQDVADRQGGGTGQQLSLKVGGRTFTTPAVGEGGTMVHKHLGFHFD